MADHAFPGGEDAFIARYFAPLAAADPSALGLKDDAAILAPAPDNAFVITCDTLIQDRHFLFDASPKSAASVAHKALAVNVSDLVAKAATPRAYLLSLSLPPGNFEPWMQAFADTLRDCQHQWGLSLIGGDTVRSHDKFAITITAIGETKPSKLVTRANAAPGDAIFVSGTIGDAALGLRYGLNASETKTWTGLIGKLGCNALIGRSQRPMPRVNLIEPLRTHASAAIDISDGLVKDVTRLCTASGVGADIDTAEIPVSVHARTLMTHKVITLEELITGGDDYEIVACVPKLSQLDFAKSAQTAGSPVTQIGIISTQPGIRLHNSSGEQVEISKTGFDHLE